MNPWRRRVFARPDDGQSSVDYELKRKKNMNFAATPNIADGHSAPETYRTATEYWRFEIHVCNGFTEWCLLESFVKACKSTEHDEQLLQLLRQGWTATELVGLATDLSDSKWVEDGTNSLRRAVSIAARHPRLRRTS